MAILIGSLFAGKKIGNAIASHGKAIATHAEKDHVLAASALRHCATENDPCYMQALYDVTPSNYRKPLRTWFTAFGNVSVETDKAGVVTFKYSKGKKANLDGALNVSPAEYSKAPGKAGKAGEYSFKGKLESAVKSLESLLETFEEKKAAPTVIKALEATLDAARKAVKAAAHADIAAAPVKTETVKAAATVKGKGKPVTVKIAATVKTPALDTAAILARRAARQTGKLPTVPAAIAAPAATMEKVSMVG